MDHGFHSTIDAVHLRRPKEVGDTRAVFFSVLRHLRDYRLSERHLSETFSALINLTLLLVGGGPNRPPPPVVFLICTENRLR